MIVFDPKFYDPNIAVTIDPKTGLITGSPTVAQLYNGMVIPGGGFPSSAKGRVPEADSGLYAGLFRGVPNHYSDIQWGEIQPRMGIAYQLNNKTVIRAGAGRFLPALGVSDSIFLGGNPPFQPNASVSLGSVDNPGVGGAASIPLVVTTQSKAFKNPEAWAWNFTVEREIFWKSPPERGLRLPGAVCTCNEKPTSTSQPRLSWRRTQATTSTPIGRIWATAPFGKPIMLQNSMYSSFPGVLETAPFGRSPIRSRLHAVQRAWITAPTSATWFQDTYDVSMLWGPSEFDARHILAINYLYEMPFFKNHATLSGKLLGGWQISGITQFQTGLPCSVAAATDYTAGPKGSGISGVGLDSNFGCGANGQYWVVNGNPRIIGTFGPNGQWFATTNPDGSPIFTQPPAGTFNTQRVRNLIYQPGFENWNLGPLQIVPRRREQRSPVPGGSLQRLEPPELVRQ